MKKSGLVLGLVVVVLAVAVWWLMRPERPSAPKPPAASASAPSVTQGTAPSQGAEAKPAPVAAPSPASPITQNANPPAAPGAGVVVSAAMKASVAAALEAEKKLFEYAGALGWDEAKALIARRQQETKALEDRLAGLGPGGAQAIAAAYKETDDARGKLMFIHALGRIQDDAADATLQALLASESTFSFQREIVAALGQRQDAESTAIVSQIAASQTDPQLRFAAAQSLAGRADALPVLTQLIQTETSPDVQKEMIISVGAIHNDAAERALTGIAQGSMDIGIRQTAIQELARSFGAAALGVFQQLLNDPNEAIRQNAVKAVAQVHNDQAVALLQRTAASDPSEQVRATAKATLSAAPVQ
jgi:HEAT repeat protein